VCVIITTCKSQCRNTVEDRTTNNPQFEKTLPRGVNAHLTFFFFSSHAIAYRQLRTVRRLRTVDLKKSLRQSLHHAPERDFRLMPVLSVFKSMLCQYFLTPRDFDSHVPFSLGPWSLPG
jgi:hypothetical protein